MQFASHIRVSGQKTSGTSSNPHFNHQGDTYSARLCLPGEPPSSIHLCMLVVTLLMQVPYSNLRETKMLGTFSFIQASKCFSPHFFPSQSCILDCLLCFPFVLTADFILGLEQEGLFLWAGTDAVFLTCLSLALYKLLRFSGCSLLISFSLKAVWMAKKKPYD